MNNLDIQYQNLLQTILDTGVEKQTRNGRTLSIFGYQIRHKMSEGFPLLTTKKMAINSLMTELKWFLKGRTDIRYLNKNGCKIWNGDAYAKYQRACMWELERPEYTEDEFIQRVMEDDDFSRVWGQLGQIYGKQWRSWNSIDQIKELINDLKHNPDSRRLMVNAWNVGELSLMTLPPCHYGFQVYTRELKDSERFNWYANKVGSFMHHDRIEQEMDENNVPKRAISLMFNMRSTDVPLGLPFNLASYGMLLEILATEVNMISDELICNMGDSHIYINQIEGVKEQILREPFKLPEIKLSNVDILNGEFDYKTIGYECHPTIKFPLSN